MSNQYYHGPMDTIFMPIKSNKTLYHRQSGQSMIEFALILPLMVLFVVGIFELGRAFFAFIAISNAAREGARIYTFYPDTTTIGQIKSTVDYEIGTSTLVDPGKITSIDIYCGNTYATATDMATCPHEQPIRVTVKYNFEFILDAFFPALTLVRSAEMMKP